MEGGALETSMDSYESVAEISVDPITNNLRVMDEELEVPRKKGTVSSAAFTIANGFCFFLFFCFCFVICFFIIVVVLFFGAEISVWILFADCLIVIIVVLIVFCYCYSAEVLFLCQ